MNDSVVGLIVLPVTPTVNRSSNGEFFYFTRYCLGNHSIFPDE